MFLWHYDDLKDSWSFLRPAIFRKLFTLETLPFWKHHESVEERMARIQGHPDVDPHYKLMVLNGYKEVPNWWWAIVLVIAWIVGIVCLYIMQSTLPWYGFLLSTVFLWIFSLFFNSLQGLTGFGFNLQPIAQMLAGYMFPGHPLANLYFTTFAYNGAAQAGLLAKDLRIAQYAHLPPIHTFWLQIAGCLVGAIMNWVMMTTIVQNQFSTLLSVQGNSIWSGQNVQQFNTLAISWSIAPKMFSINARYQWVTIAYLIGFIVPVPFYLAAKHTRKGTFLHQAFAYINPCIILWYAGNLFVGINSSLTMFFIVGIIFQGFVRKRYPKWFVNYNYLLSAALDGGAQVMVFVLTFAVAGGSGTAHPFPIWAGNPDPSVLNSDRCMVNPANNG
jgi:OPT family oligopeptide transporter